MIVSRDFQLLEHDHSDIGVAVGGDDHALYRLSFSRLSDGSGELKGVGSGQERPELERSVVQRVVRVHFGAVRIVAATRVDRSNVRVGSHCAGRVVNHSGDGARENLDDDWDNWLELVNAATGLDQGLVDVEVEQEGDDLVRLDIRIDVQLNAGLLTARDGDVMRSLRVGDGGAVDENANLVVVAGGYVAYYGWYELRVRDGDTSGGGAAQLVFDWNTSISNWVQDVGMISWGSE